ncbi:ankyrin repeat-containing domain protein [Aspergillus floccosus]
MGADFQSLPNELILHLGEMLSDGALNRLILTNRRFAELLNPVLWKFANREDDEDSMILDLPFPSETSVSHVLDLLKYAIAVDNVPMAQKILRLCELDYTVHRDMIDEAIIEAVEHGNHHWIEMLLSKAEEQHEQMKPTPLDRAVQKAIDREDVKIIKRLLRHGKITLRCWDVVCRNTIRAKNDDLLRLFLDHAQPVPAPTTRSLSGLLNAAILVKHIPCLDVLLERGAELDTDPARYEQEPLHAAAHLGDYSVIAWLLDHGADVNAVDRHTSQTAAHVAAQNRDLLQLLVSRGADIHRQDRNGLPVLAKAARAKTPDAFNYLVEVDERLGQPGFWFQAEDINWCAAALRHACCPEIVTFLLDRIDMAQFGEEILRLSGEGYKVLLLKELHARGVSFGTRFHDGATILHRYASWRVFFYSENSTPLEKTIVEAAKFVIDARPEGIHEVDRRGNTPLHYAAYSSFRLMAQTLLERGASATSSNVRGDTPICIAQNISPRLYELVKSYGPVEEDE